MVNREALITASAEKETIGSEEAAKMLGMTRPTFYKYAQENGIESITPINPRLKRQPKFLYRKSDIERLLQMPQSA